MMPVVKLRTTNQKDVLDESSSLTTVEENKIYYNSNLLQQKREGEEIQTTTSNMHKHTDCSILNDDSTLLVTIRNVTCSFNLKTHLNLRYLALNGNNVEYRREKGKLLMKIRKPPTTASIWSSGKILCIVSSSEVEAKIASKRIARIIQRLGYNEVKFCCYKVSNVMGTCTLPFPIRIVPFSEKHKLNAQYEPELNPGVTYKIKEIKATLKIFSTGSLTVHAPNEALVKQAVEHIYPLVLPFAKINNLLDKRCLEIGQEQNNVQEQNAEVFNSPNENSSMHCPSTDELLKQFQLEFDTLLQTLV